MDTDLLCQRRLINLRHPVLFASEIDEHYFKAQYRPFDEVELAMLQKSIFC